MIIRDLFPTTLPVQFQGSWDVEVTHLAYDSRAVQPGALFFALPGTKSDGTRFVDEAIQRGAQPSWFRREPQFLPRSLRFTRLPRGGY